MDLDREIDLLLEGLMDKFKNNKNYTSQGLESAGNKMADFVYDITKNNDTDIKIGMSTDKKSFRILCTCNCPNPNVSRVLKEKLNKACKTFKKDGYIAKYNCSIDNLSNGYCGIKIEFHI